MKILAASCLRFGLGTILQFHLRTFSLNRLYLHWPPQTMVLRCECVGRCYKKIPTKLKAMQLKTIILISINIFWTHSIKSMFHVHYLHSAIFFPCFPTFGKKIMSPFLFFFLVEICAYTIQNPHVNLMSSFR